MAKKTNWQRIQSKKPRDTIKYRDVYEDQQLDRTEIEGLQSMTSRMVFTIIGTILVMLIAYFTTSFVVFSIAKFHGTAGTNTSADVSAQTGYQISDAYDYWDDNQYFSTDQLSEVAGMCYDNYSQGNIKTDSTAYEQSGLLDMNPFDGYQNMSDEELAATYFTYYAGGEVSSEGGQSQGIVYTDDENPFAGYAEMSAVAQTEKYCNKTSTGTYTMKDEYNYWHDMNEYQAWELSDVLADCYMKYRTGDFETDALETLDTEEQAESEYYNPFAGYTEMRDTDMAAKFCNKTSDGKYVFKDEYNFWNDPNSYFAHEIRDKIDEYSTRYDAEYNNIQTDSGNTNDDNNNAGVVSQAATGLAIANSGFAEYCKPGFWNVFLALAAGLIFFAVVYTLLKKNLAAQNMLNDTADINQFTNDQHIALPEEVQRKFDWFPDAGAHCPVQVSSMISHVMLTNKGINPVDFTVRHKKDILDEDGNVDIYAGEPVLDENENVVTERVPMFDKEFAEDIYETSGVLEKEIRKYYDPTKIPYNGDGRDRTKQGGKWNTVAEMINNTWHIPEYEPQRPAGAYLVDTEPVNTMVLAIDG